MSKSHPAARVFRRAWDGVLAVDRFVRLHQLFFTAVWPLLGAASVGRDLTTSELIALLAVTVCFLVSAAVFNDIIDLPIDRTDPQRQHDPLVRGVVRPWQALLIAGVQPILTVPLTMWLGGTLGAHLTLAAAFVLMAVYNRWGKRCVFPPLTDAIQGTSWACLALYGPQALGAQPNPLTWLVAAYVAVLTLFFNGIHGSLRDLSNDLARGARTAAIFLGARPAHENRPAHVPVALAVYASVVLALLVGTSAVLMVRNDFGYGPIAWTVTTLAVAGINLWAVKLQPKVVGPPGPDWGAAWRLQLYLVTMTLPVAFLAYASAEISVVLLVLNVFALVLFGSTPPVVRWVWMAIRSLVRPADGKRLAADIPTTD